uniref:RNA helicase n=1 Tax=Panagrolaimus sp. ES5 TaxID=591445 RepID=A0AC34FAJ7_9BILA
MLRTDDFKTKILQHAVYRDNVAAVLCNVYDLDGYYKTLLRHTLVRPLVYNVLSRQLQTFLKLPYEKNYQHAATKFKIQASLEFVEEMKKCARPVIDAIVATCFGADGRSGPAIYTFTIKKLEVIDDFDTFGNFIIVKSCDLHGTAPFVVYQGTCERKPNGDYIFYGSHADATSRFAKTDKITVFRKPYSREFENWCRLARDVYKMDDISIKVFDPLPDPPENSVIHQVQVSRALNQSQELAVKGLLNQNPRNAFVLFGPPGTGKTYTLITAIEAIKNAFDKRNENFRFLICAHSNMAVDNFAIALVNAGIFENREMFRAYSSQLNDSPCHPSIDRITYSERDAGYAVPHNQKNWSREKRVVMCTIGFHRSLLKAFGIGDFSHIYIDEAGQARDPEVLMPLFTFGNKNTCFAIAGDPKQLGPVITSEILRNPEYNCDLSTLSRLCDNNIYGEFCSNGKNFVMLNINFRSQQYITKLVSNLFYDNNLLSSEPSDCNDYIDRCILLGNSKYPIIFWAVNGKEIRGSTLSFKNEFEASVVCEAIYTLMQYKENENNEPITPLIESKIGVVTPYKDNVNEIKKRLQKSYPTVTVDCVERYQGSERDVIIFSAVRTESLGFLSDSKRLCTAISRPRKLLVIIGCPKLLVKDEKWKKMIYYLYQCGGVFPRRTDGIWNNLF